MNTSTGTDPHFVTGRRILSMVVPSQGNAPQEPTQVSPLPLMRMATAFWSFRALVSAHELGLFDRLSATGGATAPELAREWGTDMRPTQILLTACTALELLVKDGDRYRNSEMAETYLVPDKPYYFGGWLMMSEKLIHPASLKLLDAVRTNSPVMTADDERQSPFADPDERTRTLVWDGMHALSSFTARALSQVADFSGVRRLLDVGGGSGAYGIELCRRHPGLRTTVYDIAPACAVAQKKAAEAGLTERIDVHTGDFFRDAELPRGHDAVLLSLVLHSWAEEQDLEILRKCHRALPSGGRVFISELLLDDELTGPIQPALMSLNMLTHTRGRSYSGAEYTRWLTGTGFTDVRVLPMKALGANGVVTAVKP
ncbi:methyltransferase [Streptomyces capparidis]